MILVAGIAAVVVIDGLLVLVRVVLGLPSGVAGTRVVCSGRETELGNGGGLKSRGAPLDEGPVPRRRPRPLGEPFVPAAVGVAEEVALRAFPAIALSESVTFLTSPIESGIKKHDGIEDSKCISRVISVS